MVEYTDNAIAYTWELAGAQGASFILFPSSDNSPNDIKAAKKYLRDNHDVVRLRIASEEDRDELYRAAIFRHPKTRPLKWYEINADAGSTLVRKERKKGTSPDEYVEKFVLPFIEETRLRYIDKYGENLKP